MNKVTKKQLNEKNAEIKNLLACTSIYRDNNDFESLARCLRAMNIRVQELQNLYSFYENQQIIKMGVNPFTGEKIVNGGVNPFTGEKVGA